MILREKKRIPLIENVKYAMIVLLLGCILGFLAKWFDLHVEMLGTIFSEWSVWIVIGVIITMKCESPLRTVVYMFLFCMGMLNVYYAMAVQVDAIWNIHFAYTWGLFAVGISLASYFVWYAKGDGMIANVLKIMILLGMFLGQFLLYRVRAWDFGMMIIVGYILYKN